ncbi:substrate-binding domain-containing protein [Microbacterium sp. NPDC056052]|uniref:substrate-binding domain-containing protein n=1 Tax=Microbacterium sp. NPDC056052 TaxID=3345695 RepID=UPI0035DC2BFB
MGTSSSALGEVRRTQLVQQLARRGVSRASTLAAELGVSVATMRRDLTQLADEGVVMRVHGGAMLCADRAPADAYLHRSDADPVTGVIAVLVPSTDYYWPGVLGGIQAGARSYALSTLLRRGSYTSIDERAAVEALLKTERLAGVVIAPNTRAPFAGEVLQMLSEATVPVVLVERTGIAGEYRMPLEAVVTDHGLGVALAARHLHALGHRRVGLVTVRESQTSRRLLSSWPAACRELGLQSHEHFAQPAGPEDQDSQELAISEAIDTALANDVTGLVVHSDPEAMSLVEGAKAQGLRVPQDLSVIAYDDQVAALFSPALTAISPPRHAIGSAAVELIVERIADPVRPLRRVILSPDLIVRESTGPARV